MRNVQGGDFIGEGGYGLQGGGSGAWWGFAFIVFIIFAIIIAFAWLNGNKRDDYGLERLLPFLGMFKGHGGHGHDDGYHHTELVKDQAKDTGAIIHNQDIRAYELKSAMDNNSRFLEKNIDSFRNDQKDDTIAELRAKLIEEKTMGAICHSHDDLKRELGCLKEHFKPGWFDHAYGCGK